MKTLSTHELQAISGGSPRYSNSFVAGMKNDANFHVMLSTEALVFMGLGATIGLVGGPLVAATGAITGNMIGSLLALNEYTLGANYREVQSLVTQQ